MKASKFFCKGEPGQEQFFFAVPAKTARKLPFKIDESVEWIVVDEDIVVLRRTDEPFVAVKKKPETTSRLFW